jgi:hypothetical protein
MRARREASEGARFLSPHQTKTLVIILLGCIPPIIDASHVPLSYDPTIAVTPLVCA